VLHKDVGIGRIARPNGIKRLPIVLTQDEVRRLLARLEGTPAADRPGRPALRSGAALPVAR
jgi:hypothetical protein